MYFDTIRGFKPISMSDYAVIQSDFSQKHVVEQNGFREMEIIIQFR